VASQQRIQRGHVSQILQLFFTWVPVCNCGPDAGSKELVKVHVKGVSWGWRCVACSMQWCLDTASSTQGHCIELPASQHALHGLGSAYGRMLGPVMAGVVLSSIWHSQMCLVKVDNNCAGILGGSWHAILACWGGSRPIPWDLCVNCEWAALSAGVMGCFSGG